MKKVLIGLIIVIAMIPCSIVAAGCINYFAYEEDPIFLNSQFVFESYHDGTCYVAKYRESCCGFVVGTIAGAYGWNIYRVEIPEYSPNGDKVVAIGDKAFFDTRIVGLKIPDSVTSIGDGALGCDNLKDVYYTGTEEEWEAISIEDGNYLLTDATIHYNYDPNAQ